MSNVKDSPTWISENKVLANNFRILKKMISEASDQKLVGMTVYSVGEMELITTAKILGQKMMVSYGSARNFILLLKKHGVIDYYSIGKGGAKAMKIKLL